MNKHVLISQALENAKCEEHNQRIILIAPNTLKPYCIACQHQDMGVEDVKEFLQRQFEQECNQEASVSAQQRALLKTEQNLIDYLFLNEFPLPEGYTIIDTQ